MPLSERLLVKGQATELSAMDGGSKVVLAFHGHEPLGCPIVWRG
jgi:hypothetical protein